MSLYKGYHSSVACGVSISDSSPQVIYGTFPVATVLQGSTMFPSPGCCQGSWESTSKRPPHLSAAVIQGSSVLPQLLQYNQIP